VNSGERRSLANDIFPRTGPDRTDKSVIQLHHQADRMAQARQNQIGTAIAVSQDARLSRRLLP